MYVAVEVSMKSNFGIPHLDDRLSRKKYVQIQCVYRVQLKLHEIGCSFTGNKIILKMSFEKHFLIFFGQSSKWGVPKLDLIETFKTTYRCLGVFISTFSILKTSLQNS